MWKKKKLNECCLSIADGDHQPPPKAETGVPFVTIANIVNNKFDFTNTMFTPESYYNSLDSKRRAQVGDVLYSVVGSFGIPVLISEPQRFVFQRHIAILRCNKEILLPEYLYYVMLTRDFYMMADTVALGAAQRTISLTSLRNLEIEVPPLDIQERIVNKIFPYDALIKNSQKQIKLLEEAAQRLYKEWFVDLRFPGYENTSIVDGVPDGWIKETIDSRIELLSGYAFKSSEFCADGKYKIVTIKNVKGGQFDGENVSCLLEIPAKMPTHCSLVDGDILLSLTGNVGRVCLVYGEDYLLNQRVAKLKSQTPAFTYCLFRSKDMFDEMNNLANGAAQQNLSPIRTGKIKNVFPTDETIQKFEKIVFPMIKKIIILNKSNIKIAEARDRLLPKLMNGEIKI